MTFLNNPLVIVVVPNLDNHIHLFKRRLDDRINELVEKVSSAHPDDKEFEAMKLFSSIAFRSLPLPQFEPP
jgi:hypothetical protein